MPTLFDKIIAILMMTYIIFKFCSAIFYLYKMRKYGRLSDNLRKMLKGE